MNQDCRFVCRTNPVFIPALVFSLASTSAFASAWTDNGTSGIVNTGRVGILGPGANSTLPQARLHVDVIGTSTDLPGLIGESPNATPGTKSAILQLNINGAANYPALLIWNHSAGQVATIKKDGSATFNGSMLAGRFSTNGNFQTAMMTAEASGTRYFELRDGNTVRTFIDPASQSNTAYFSQLMGLGVTAPGARLHVQTDGASTELPALIGETSNPTPGAKAAILQINVNNAATYPALRFWNHSSGEVAKINKDGSASFNGPVLAGRFSTNANYQSAMITTEASGTRYFELRDGPTVRTFIDPASGSNTAYFSQKMGIGATAPSARLQVLSDGASTEQTAVIGESANPSPGAKSSIFQVNINDAASYPAIRVWNHSSGEVAKIGKDGSASFSGPMLANRFSTNSNFQTAMLTVEASGTRYFELRDGGTVRDFIDPASGCNTAYFSQKVGIGTSTPSEQLEVNGNIKASGNLQVASVNTKVWSVAPDYVFEKGYKLAPLEHVEKYVDEHKHLPDIPSAGEFKNKGLDLADMNMKLLRKVEELTLYSIQQQKEIKDLKNRLGRIEAGKR